MIFTRPTSLSQAFRTLAEKALLPTDMSSAELRGLDSDLRARSVFSARTTKAGYLQDVKNVLGELLAPELSSDQGRPQMNIASGRAVLQDMLDRLAYDPAKGFGDGEAPPAEAGSLKDLSSDKRLQLMLETNVRQVANYAYQKSGQTDFALFAYPALELVRIYPRQIPRGQRRGRGGAIVADPENAWTARWVRAGGKLYGGRMIARKDDPVWEQLGSSTMFDDGLDSTHPPFAFNSGMGVQEVPREEAIALGVIEKETDIQGSKRSMNEGLKAAAKIDADFLKALSADLDVAISAGEARLRNRREVFKPQRRRDAEGKPEVILNKLADALHAADRGVARVTQIDKMRHRLERLNAVLAGKAVRA